MTLHLPHLHVSWIGHARQADTYPPPRFAWSPAAWKGPVNQPAGPAPDSPKLAVTGNITGQRVFEGNCASCHAWTGAGALIGAAQLTGNRAINDVSATNVVQAILNGSGTFDGSSYMPSFAAVYSDAEVAAVANYVTARFGSNPSRVTPDQVAMLRLQN